MERRHYSHFLTLLLYCIVLSSLCLFSIADDQLEESWFDEDDDDTVDNMIKKAPNDKRGSCDMSSGKWVFDESYPLYDPSCSYLSTKVSCQRNGRPDSDYQKWRWQPHGCSIPRFHALDFLGRMRRKRVMLVGDSIMRNQWESLVCLVESVMPTGRKVVTYNGPTMAFHALDFETSIEFTWAPFLVEVKDGPKNERVLHLDSIEENAKLWKGVDILVFDSAHWWTHSGTLSSWDYCMEGKTVLRNLNPMVAYEKGLTTWAKWIDLNLDPKRTTVVFRTMSPRHNRDNGWKCYNQREPIEHFTHQPHIPGQFFVLQEVLKKMSFPVYLQDITRMSTFRRDGHPSIYGRARDQKQRLHMKDYTSDCSHWCLPGVPDAWNEMFNAMLLNMREHTS